jgi:hypothetical protein
VTTLERARAAAVDRRWRQSAAIASVKRVQFRGPVSDVSAQCERLEEFPELWGPRLPVVQLIKRAVGALKLL